MVVGHAPKVQRLGDTLHPFSLFMLCVKNNVTEREQEHQLFMENIAYFLFYKLFFEHILIDICQYLNLMSTNFEFHYEN